MKALFVFCLLFLSAAQEALGRTTIEVPIFEGGCGLTFFFEAARGYEEARPDVLVDLYGDPRIADKIRVRVLEGTYPEVTNAGLNYWALIRNGQVQPLDEYLDGPNWEGDKTWRQSFLPGSLDRFQYQGKTYGIPFLYVVFAVWYNKNMFAEHGWEPARTWDEFFALCEQIKAAGIPPLAFQGRYPGYAGAVIDNSYYHLAGRERYYQQKDLIPGSFANPEFEQSLSFIQRTAQKLLPARRSGDEPYRGPVGVFHRADGHDLLRLLAQERNAGQDTLRFSPRCLQPAHSRCRQGRSQCHLHRHRILLCHEEQPPPRNRRGFPALYDLARNGRHLRPDARYYSGGRRRDGGPGERRYARPDRPDAPGHHYVRNRPLARVSRR